MSIGVCIVEWGFGLVLGAVELGEMGAGWDVMWLVGERRGGMGLGGGGGWDRIGWGGGVWNKNNESNTVERYTSTSG